MLEKGEGGLNMPRGLNEEERKNDKSAEEYQIRGAQDK